MVSAYTRNGYYAAELDEHTAVLRTARDRLAEPFSRILDLWLAAVRSGNKILFFGNGGSAGDAQHLATELTVRFKANRPPIAALALTTDTSTLTAIGNDLGFDQIFARQIEAIGRKGDVAVAISTSGRSPNVIEGLKAARRLGIATVAFGGGTGGDMAALADAILIVPSATTARIQEMHVTFGQMLCGALEIELGLVQG
jgi:D-sedoheptulose 7-phosphate isomerase